MAGLFTTLNIGSQSLQAHQLGVQVAGHNISNVNNPAYSRQRLILETAIATPSSVGLQGTGVQAVMIRQIRDQLIDNNIRNETSITSYLEAQQKALEFANAYLAERINLSDLNNNQTSSNLSDLIDGFFSAFQDISVNPESISERVVLLQKAQLMSSRFNQISSTLDNLIQSMNESINSDTAKANSLLSEIADLNIQINNLETNKNWLANDLRDTLQQKLEELSKIIKIDVSENEQGLAVISVNGEMLVNGDKLLDTIETYTDASNRVYIQTVNSKISITSTSGSIQGTIDARDRSVLQIKQSLDNLANLLITEVNNLHSTGYGLNGTNNTAFFSGSNAADIQVNSALIENPELIQLSNNPAAPGNNFIALAIAQLKTKTQPSLNNLTIPGFYTKTVETIAADLNAVNSKLSDQKTITELFEQRRQSVSGVSIDEEMTELLKYQKAYQASAKLISTVDELLETLINMKR